MAPATDRRKSKKGDRPAAALSHKALYGSAAEKIVRATVERHCDFSAAEASIVQNGTEAYHTGGKNMPIIYGDYYLLEALLRMQNKDTLYW